MNAIISGNNYLRPEVEIIPITTEGPVAQVSKPGGEGHGPNDGWED